MYKAFEKNIVNRYGQKYEVGVIYRAKGDVKFGTQGNGYHMCKNMEDTFRYYDFKENESIVTKVEGIGKFDEYEDDYYGYYDMYAYEAMKILKVLTREEIIEYFKDLKFNMQIERFLMGFKFTMDELYIIREILIKKLEYSYMKDYMHLYQEISYEKLLKM